MSAREAASVAMKPSPQSMSPRLRGGQPAEAVVPSPPHHQQQQLQKQASQLHAYYEPGGGNAGCCLEDVTGRAGDLLKKVPPCTSKLGL